MILGIIGAALGGIGIAALGGAFGLPLFLLVVPLGLVLGNEIDEAGVTKKVIERLRKIDLGQAAAFCAKILIGAPGRPR